MAGRRLRSTPDGTENKSKLGSSKDVLSLLDHTRMAGIKKDFQRLGNALTLTEFVAVMKSYLPFDTYGELAMTTSLCQFFSDVDVNGDGTMEWEEFTNFIVETGMTAMATQKVGTQIDEYNISDIVDKSKYNSVCLIQKLFNIPKLAQMIVLQKKSTGFRVVSTKDGSLLFKVNNAHKSEILCATYLPKFNWVATSGNDRTIRFWNVLDGYKPAKCLILNSSAHSALEWSEECERLISGDDFGNLHCRSIYYDLDIDSGMEYKHKNDVVVKGHLDPITDIISLDNMSSIASASMDGTISLWDAKTMRQRSVLHGHVKGVFKLAYHPEYHILFSAAFETNAFAWNPYCAKNICKLEGHYHPLAGIQTIPGTPQVVTVDTAGIAKVWDIRNFSCVQTIYAENYLGYRIHSVSDFAALAPFHRLAFSSKLQLHFYDSSAYVQEENPYLTDSNTTVAVVYNSDAAMFVTASGRDIKLWDEYSGEFVRVYKDVCPADITSMCLDSLKKKIIVGDAEGNIYLLNLLNGARIKSVQTGHQGPISFLFHHKGKCIPRATEREFSSASTLMSASWDGFTKLYDEDEEERLPLVKKLACKMEITCAAYSSNIHLMACGTNAGKVILWDAFTDSGEGAVTAHQGEITSLAFLDPYPVLAVGDSQGNLCLWAVRPLVQKEPICLLRVLNTEENKRDFTLANPVTSILFRYNVSYQEGQILEKLNGNVPSQAADAAAASGSGSCGDEKRSSVEREERGVAPSPSPSPLPSSASSSLPREKSNDSSAPCPLSLPPPPEASNGDYLYTGDVNGEVKVWNIRHVMERWDILPFDVDELVRVTLQSRAMSDMNSMLSATEGHQNKSAPTSPFTSAPNSPVNTLRKLKSTAAADGDGADCPQVSSPADQIECVSRALSLQRPQTMSGETSKLRNRALQRGASHSMYRSLLYQRFGVILKGALEGAERVHILQPGDLVLMRRWKAHSDAISDLKLVEQTVSQLDNQTIVQRSRRQIMRMSSRHTPVAAETPLRQVSSRKSIVTASHDNTVRVWSPEGFERGQLQQGRHTRIFKTVSDKQHDFKEWTFSSKASQTGRLIASEQKALGVLDDVEKCKEKLDQRLNRVPASHTRASSLSRRSTGVSTARETEDAIPPTPCLPRKLSIAQQVAMESPRSSRRRSSKLVRVKMAQQEELKQERAHGRRSAKRSTLELKLSQLSLSPRNNPRDSVTLSSARSAKVQEEIEASGEAEIAQDTVFLTQQENED